jgi:hypothetical protein
MIEMREKEVELEFRFQERKKFNSFNLTAVISGYNPMKDFINTNFV